MPGTFLGTAAVTVNKPALFAALKSAYSRPERDHKEVST